jgi:hypothetical protein
MKIWTSTQPGDDNIIAYYNDTLYKARPGSAKLDAYLQDLQTHKEKARGFFTIPAHYVSEINAQTGKKQITVIFRGDTEELIVTDDITRQQIFDHLQSNMPGAVASTVTYSKWQLGKKPIIAMAVTAAIGIWALYIAFQTENGAAYDVTGGQYHSLAGIILALASLGTAKLSLIFGGLFALAAYRFVRNTRQPVTRQVLRFGR